MAPEKRPAFQFYPRDFLTDEQVLKMSYTERGVYITLLSQCWLHQSLPADMSQLATMLALPLSRMRKLWTGPIRQCFRVEGDRLYQKRLDVERAKQDKFRRRQSDAAASRWHAISDATAYPKPMPDACPRDEDRKEKSLSALEKGSGEKPPPDVGEIAARFLERYQALYAEYRHGAKLHIKPSLDWTRVCDLLGTWDVQRLEELAVILLTTDDEWIAKTDRGIGVFVARASWCDDRLKADEATE